MRLLNLLLSFDLDLPIECDDEYWTNDDPSLAFVQPPGKSSSVTCFVQFAKLGFITGAALRTLVISHL